MSVALAAGNLFSQTTTGELNESTESDSSVANDAVLYPEKTAPSRAEYLRSTPWIEIIEREIPKLTHDHGNRLPMIMWYGVGYEPLSPEEIRVLTDRGLTQHLPMSPSSIEAAKRLQQAGMPVILMEGRTDAWPNSLAGEPTTWQHQFDADYRPDWMTDPNAFGWHGACPTQRDGWKVLQQQTRDCMRAFSDSGITVTGVWMDWEGDPYPWSHSFEQINHCQRCQDTLPADVLNDKDQWWQYAWKQYVERYDQYFAQSVREIFPKCLVTNWHVVRSTERQPVRYFVGDRFLPAVKLIYFNATNPIAYGSDMVWTQRNREPLPLTQKNVDSFYRSEILQQVKTDSLNRAEVGFSEIACVPWVARYCRIAPGDEPIPMMSRPAYREALAELWRCELTTMQVFNAMHEGYEEYAVKELHDAVVAYDQSR